MDQTIIDIDKLIPEPRKIISDGQEILVNPPTMAQMLRISRISRRLEEESDDVSPQQLESMVKSLCQVIWECIPELNQKEFKPPQTKYLTNILAELAVSPDELDEANKVKAARMKALSKGIQDPKVPEQSQSLES